MGCLITLLQRPCSSCIRKKSDRNNPRINIQNTSHISSDSSILNSSLTYNNSDFNKEVSTVDILSEDEHVNTDFYILLDESLSKVSG